MAVCFTKKNKKTKYKKHFNKAIKRRHKKIDEDKFFSINFNKKGKVVFYLRYCFQKSTNLLDKTKSFKNAFFKKKRLLIHSLNLINSSITSKQ